MSRHRFVRGLDLDEERDVAERDDTDDGMTPEQQEQMATSMPIAKAFLKDIRPPISDDAIAQSLWHYWFDVDKAVTWLRKDWEKKGQPIPIELLPCPGGPRQRPHRPSHSVTTSAAPDSAMKNLSINTTSSQSSSSTHETEVTPPAQESSKPMSKLALLAQKRRETAQTSSSPSFQSAPAVNQPLTSRPEAPSPKPLSKLAQKMAAARASKTQPGTPASDTTEHRSAGIVSTMMRDVDHASHDELYPAPGSTSNPIMAPSAFFNILTKSTPASAPFPQFTYHNHIPTVFDEDDLIRRIHAAFSDAESPDDIVLRALAKASSPATPSTPKSVSQPGKPRSQPGSLIKSATQPGTPRSVPKPKASSSGNRTPTTPGPSGLSTARQDLEGLHLGENADQADLDREREKFKEKTVVSVKREDLIAKVKREEAESGKQNMSLIVVGHVDAGKSTLMGRLLYDIGELSEKEKTANERGSKRVGKSSFAFAWGLDALGDERDRGVTIDIATTHFSTPHRNITLLDAPGHRDFIPAMISGAAQADVALLVVDGSPGEFEAGFERGGQTREHAWLVRSLGVKEIVVGVNKMDLVDWSQDRYDEIVDSLKPFLVSAGFTASKTVFLPLAAMEGTNVLVNEDPLLKAWYDGPTLIDTLDKAEVPARPYESPLRIPVSNVFKGQTAIASGVAVSGRLCSGVVQVGDRLRAIPGDEVGSVRTIEVDDESAPYATAGQNVTLYLAGIDPIHLAIGTVLCPPSQPVSLVSKFTAQILVFDLQSPIISGTPVELFHHSVNLPATISKLISISEKGQVTRKNPRVLQKGTTATVELTFRPTGGSSKVPTLALETAAENKEMGRVLIRRGGETIAAGVVMEILA
ncbi:hypothetical protein TREMEDRAFT_71549 [Tremella mesenterica DSM 1558]|uniref:uncharacterized protein n=1 Tax=Tremella mesenterica (strain ATCC 24925 / CBS 8224 / DSM 1558 / NBRC 9311 / NRRL Y-6157 / RJB 2259-6 / UBC 559-6) TaxID=578456 RepID=UPI0003F4955C|nr:uncharacterized protein TREMEDRAFT_71549 [Tremella mesenterica DSM 1558]EIW70184.1 hypothetical protein TREMEDRAFT_71549 [Tremella mesenterica DSM 1558]